MPACRFGRSYDVPLNRSTQLHLHLYVYEYNTNGSLPFILFDVLSPGVGEDTVVGNARSSVICNHYLLNDYIGWGSVWHAHGSWWIQFVRCQFFPKIIPWISTSNETPTRRKISVLYIRMRRRANAREKKMREASSENALEWVFLMSFTVDGRNCSAQQRT